MPDVKTAGLGHSSSAQSPTVRLELELDLVDFLVRKCEASERAGLLLIQTVESLDLAEKLVADYEKFKRLRGIMQAAKLSQGL